jgi:uncharacterized protein (TIGR03435 family)
MMQTLLAQRFKLVAHREEKQLSYFALVRAKNGPKIQAVADIPTVSGRSAMEAASAAGDPGRPAWSFAFHRSHGAARAKTGSPKGSSRGSRCG